MSIVILRHRPTSTPGLLFLTAARSNKREFQNREHLKHFSVFVYESRSKLDAFNDICRLKTSFSKAPGRDVKSAISSLTTDEGDGKSVFGAFC